MDLHTLKHNLAQTPDKIVRFILPGGRDIPARYPVTEVGHVTKRFID